MPPKNRKPPVFDVFKEYGGGTLGKNGLLEPAVQVFFYEFCKSFENSFSIKLF